MHPAIALTYFVVSFSMGVFGAESKNHAETKVQEHHTSSTLTLCPTSAAAR